MQPKEVVVEFLNRLNAGDIEGAGELCAPDMEEHWPMGSRIGSKATRKGRARVREAFPDHKIEILNVFAEGNQVCVEQRFTGTNTGGSASFSNPTMPPTNRSINIHGCDVYHVQDGLITHTFLYYDVHQVRSQLGVTDSDVGSPYPDPSGLYPRASKVAR